MSSLKRLFRRLRGVRSDNPVRGKVEEELTGHLDMLIEENLAEGMSPDEARAAARQRFGDYEGILTEGFHLRWGAVRAGRRSTFWDLLLQDLRHGVRSLARRPGFAAAAVLTLALGIGANAAMFSVIKTVVLAPLPFKDPDRVVQLWDVHSHQERDFADMMSRANFRDYKNLNEAFSHFAAVGWINTLYVDRENRFDLVKGVHVSADLFEMMGVVPTRGRTFWAEEDLEGVGTIVLLTHAYWLREFGGEKVVGRTIALRRWVPGVRPNLQELEYEIIGVLPPDFRLPPLLRDTVYGVWTEPDVVLPLGLHTWGGLERDMWSLYSLAQLRDGVTVEQARANLQAIAAGIAESAPDTEKGLEVMVVPVGELLRQEYGVALGFLWAATALVLLVACASVSSLLLGWGVAREQELALRAALGAGARRIFGQLITESMVIAAAAGVLGVLLAYWGIAAPRLPGRGHSACW